MRLLIPFLIPFLPLIHAQLPSQDCPIGWPAPPEPRNVPLTTNLYDLLTTYTTSQPPFANLARNLRLRTSVLHDLLFIVETSPGTRYDNPITPLLDGTRETTPIPQIRALYDFITTRRLQCYDPNQPWQLAYALLAFNEDVQNKGSRFERTTVNAELAEQFQNLIVDMVQNTKTINENNFNYDQNLIQKLRLIQMGNGGVNSNGGTPGGDGGNQGGWTEAERALREFVEVIREFTGNSYWMRKQVRPEIIKNYAILGRAREIGLAGRAGQIAPENIEKTYVPGTRR